MTVEAFEISITEQPRYAAEDSTEPTQGPAYVGVFTPRVTRTASGVSNYPEYPNHPYIDGTRVCKSAPSLVDDGGELTANGRLYPGEGALQ
jgi:hypothetical protein